MTVIQIIVQPVIIIDMLQNFVELLSDHKHSVTPLDAEVCFGCIAACWNEKRSHVKISEDMTSEQRNRMPLQCGQYYTRIESNRKWPQFSNLNNIWTTYAVVLHGAGSHHETLT